MDLESRYRQIFETVNALRDFPLEQLEKSRSLFQIEGETITPRRFEVWTCLVGLPMSDRLTRRLQAIAAEVTSILPSGVHFYPVIPAHYHWELYIIKRPTEEVCAENLAEAGEILREVLSQQAAIAMSYRGFLVTPDGTIIVRGYGAFDELRQRLRDRIPFASRQQSQLGHISLGRILDPIGEDSFNRLKQRILESKNECYGEFDITEAKYVHERQWYMEECDVIFTLLFRKNGDR